MAAKSEIQHSVDQHSLPPPEAARRDSGRGGRRLVFHPSIPHPFLTQHPVARQRIPLGLGLAQVPNATPTSAVVINLQRHPLLQVRHLSEVQHTRLAPSELCNTYIRGTFRCCVTSYSREATFVAECGGQHRYPRLPNGWKISNVWTNAGRRNHANHPQRTIRSAGRRTP